MQQRRLIRQEISFDLLYPQPAAISATCVSCPSLLFACLCPGTSSLAYVYFAELGEPADTVDFELNRLLACTFGFHITSLVIHSLVSVGCERRRH